MLQHLQALINHFKKLIKQFSGSEKHSSWKNIEPHHHLLMNFQMVTKECNGAIAKAKEYFQDLHTQFEVCYVCKIACNLLNNKELIKKVIMLLFVM